MLQNYNVTINDFVQLTAAGVKVASFVQIRSALIDRYKQVYGNDIDLSTGTADGVFVNDLALIINNIVQTMQSLYSNLNVNTASGVYLDSLCALSNVQRKQPTRSNVSLTVTNSLNVQTSTFDGLTFVDKSGTEWVTTGEITFEPNETKELYAECTEFGKIEAPAGWIDKTVDVTYLLVEQSHDANVGSNQESDVELRARRTYSAGSAGVTVLESLVGALLNVSGIDDVLIYNNNDIASKVAADGSTIDPHSIYVVLKLRDGVVVTDETIGRLIHEKLTPGIHSCQFAGSNGIGHSYLYTSDVYGVTIDESIQNVFWKKATPIHPDLKITLKPLATFTTDEFDVIANAAINYMNSLKLGQVGNSSDIIVETMSVDPKFNGRSTYYIESVNVSDAQSDTYYNYSSYDVVQDGQSWIMTLS